jgi:pimeloyl-ACP methyl ester carboxylesterase
MNGFDATWFSQPLPVRSEVAILSPQFPGGRGSIEYLEAGAEEAPAVLLLHGLGSNAEGYRLQLADLSDALRLIAWNAPGYGNSSHLLSDAPDADSYVEVIVAMLDALNIGRLAALVGSSWGSVIATAFAAKHPQRTRSLVLSAPNTGRGHLTGVQREGELQSMLGAIDVAVNRKAIADRLIAQQADTRVRACVERLRDAVTPRGWKQAVHTLFGISTLELVRRIECPIFIAVGKLDRVAPIEAHAARLAAVAPNIELREFDGVGHIVKLEAAREFNALLQKAASQ